MSQTERPATASVEQRLDELQRESEARRQELRQIAAQLPATMSRRAIVRGVVTDFRNAPGKGDVISRGLRKLARAPRGAFRAARHAVRARRR